MNVDIEKKGLNLRIDEPPYLPLKPSGLRLWHFIAGGFLLGLILPIGVLYGLLQIDPRVRNADQLSAITDIPVIGRINECYTGLEMNQIKNSYYIIFMLGLLTVVAVGLIAYNFR